MTISSASSLTLEFLLAGTLTG